MMYRNCIELAGIIANEPELRTLPNGTKVINLRMEERTKRRESGREVDHANWFGLVFYGPLVDAAILYRKGENIFVRGSVQQRSYTPKDGSPRTVWEVVVDHSHIVAPRLRTTPQEDKVNGTPHVWPV